MERYPGLRSIFLNLIDFEESRVFCRLLTRFLVSLVLIGTFGCGEGREGPSGLHQFFENALRREATAHERKMVVRVNAGCTAFFVANAKNRTLLVSARHCFDFNITDACAKGFRMTDNSGRIGTCVKVMVSDPIHDIALFEAKFPSGPDASATLQLAGYEPPLNAQLVMLGYPADKDRKGKLTVTEDCWVLKTRISSPWTDVVDRSALHNCSTYGGNSGGPMIEEGTQVALGLPFSYRPNDYKLYSSVSLKTASYMAQMAGFVANNRSALDAFEVDIAD